MTFIDKVNNINPADYNDDDNINGVGDPGYIPNEPENDVTLPTSDTNSVSSASGSQTGTQRSALTSNGAEKNEESNYLPSSDGEDPSSLEEKMNDILSEFFNFTENFNEEDYIEQDENGFKSFKGEKWSKQYNRFRSLFSYALIGNMISQSRENVISIMREIFDGYENKKNEKNKNDRYSEEQTAKWIEDAYKKLNDASESMFSNIQQHNYTVYQQKVQKTDEYLDDWYDQLWNFISGGDQERRKLEDIQKATAEYKAATERTYQSLLGTLDMTIFSGLNENIAAQVNGAFKDLKNAPINKIGENGYIDLPQTKDTILNIRAKLNAGLQAQNILSTLTGNKQEIVETVMSESYGVSIDSSVQRGSRRAITEEANQSRQLFDQISENAIQIVKLHNQENYLKKQLEKMRIMQVFNIFGNIFNLAALVLGILAAVFAWMPPVAATLGALSAGCAGMGAGLRYLGSAIADAAIKDEYKPSRKSHQAKSFDASFVSPAENKAALLEAAAEKYLEKITMKDEQDDYENLKKLKDRTLVMSYAKIGSFQDTLKAIDNALRLLLEMRETAWAIQDMVWATFNVKKSSASNTALLDQNLENIISSNNLLTKKLISDLQEVQQAYNSEIEQQKNMEKATTNFWVSMGGAAIGAVTGGLIGGFATLGWSLGMALAGAGAAIFNAVGPQSAFGMTWNEEFSDVRFILNTQESNNDTTYEMMENLEKSIYTDLAKNGIIKTKDGYAILDNNLMADLYDRLKRLANFISVIISMRQVKEDIISNILAQEGISLRSGKRRTSQIYYAEIRRMLDNFNNVKSLLGEKIRVQNAALDAEKEAQVAITRGVVSTGVAALGLGLSAIDTISKLMLNLTPSLMGLSSSLVDLVANLVWSANAPGEKDIAGPIRAIKEIQEGRNSLEKTLSQLDKKEIEIYLDKGFLENMGSGRLGINALFLSEAQNNLKKISTVREAIAQILDTQRQLIAETGKLNGIQLTDNSALKDVIRVSQNLTNYIMEAQYRAVKTAADTGNRKLQHERAALASFMSTLMQIASLVLSIRQGLLEKASTDFRRDVNQLRDINPQKLETNKLDFQSKEFRMQEMNKHLLLEAMLFNIQDALNKLVSNLIFDEARDKKSSKEESEEKVKEETNRAKSIKGKGLANSLDRLETLSRALSLEASKIDYDMEKTAIHTGRMKEIYDLTQSLVENFLKDYSSHLKARRKKPEYYFKGEQEKMKKKTELKAVPLHNPNLVYNLPATLKIEHVPQSLSLLTQYIEQIENRVREAKDALSQPALSPADIKAAKSPEKLDIPALRQHIQKLRDNIEVLLRVIKSSQDDLVKSKEDSRSLHGSLARAAAEADKLKKEYLDLQAKNDPRAEQVLKKYKEAEAKIIQLQAAVKQQTEKISNLLQKITADIKELKSLRGELAKAQAALTQAEKQKDNASIVPKATSSIKFKKSETLYDKYRFAQEESERIFGHISPKNSLVNRA